MKLRKAISKIMLTMILVMLAVPVVSMMNTQVVYAVPNVDGTSKREEDKNFKGQKEADFDSSADQEKMKDTLMSIVNSEAFNEVEINDGIRMAAPFVIIVMTITAALVAVILRFFFAQTAMDLAYITLPMSRSFLMAKSESGGGAQGGKGKGSVSISESAIDAVGGGGSSGGGMGGGSGRDRSVGGAIGKYAADRSLEFSVFIIFLMLIFTGILGNVVSLLFSVFYSVLQGFLNMLTV